MRPPTRPRLAANGRARLMRFLDIAMDPHELLIERGSASLPMRFTREPGLWVVSELPDPAIASAAISARRSP